MSDLRISLFETDKQRGNSFQAIDPKFPLFFALVPPEKVKISREPQNLHAGQEGRIICESSSSNPAAEMSWWKGGIPVQGTKNGTKPGLHGGFLSFVELTLDVTEEMNGEVYTCQARNNQMDRSIHDATTLDVLCKYYTASQECVNDENQRDIDMIARTIFE